MSYRHDNLRKTKAAIQNVMASKGEGDLNRTDLNRLAHWLGEENLQQKPKDWGKKK
jgi:hypothetical protein